MSSSEWQYPGRSRQKSRYLHKVFDSRRVAKEEPDKLRASCSELLGIYGILRVFFEMRFTGVEEFRLHLDSFCESCKVLDAILEFKRGLRPISAESVGELQATMQRRLQKHIAIYGCTHITPKHHWLIDTAAQFLQDKLVLDAFVIERTHLTVKSFADFVKSTTPLKGLSCLAFCVDCMPTRKPMGANWLGQLPHCRAPVSAWLIGLWSVGWSTRWAR